MLVVAITCDVTLACIPPILLKMSACPTLRKSTRFPWGTLQSPREQKSVRLRLLVTPRSMLPRRKGTKKLTQVVPSLAVGSSDCSFSHRTRKAAGALHRTKKIGLYFRGVAHFSVA